MSVTAALFVAIGTLVLAARLFLGTERRPPIEPEDEGDDGRGGSRRDRS